MFKKLRNKLLLVNMIIISSLLLGSFSVIYVITWQNVQRVSMDQLRAAIEFDRRYQNDVRRRPEGIPPEDMMPEEDKPQNRGGHDKRTDMTAHFVIYTDADGSITDVRSPLELDDDSYKEYVTEIVSDTDNSGVISYADGYWKYLREKTKDGYIIGFISYTSERGILISLLIILSLVWLAALAAAFLISLKNANSSIRPVEESYNRQKQFVEDASHELKTPLTTINTNIDVLMSHKGSTIEEEEKWLGYIKSEAERMTKLTNDLLYLARLDHTYEKPTAEVSSLSEACENVILTMEAVIFEKSIDFDYDIEPDINAGASDSLLKQLVMILLDNAVKYTPECGKIKMSLKREQHNEAVLRVYNTGEGIGEEDIKQIFERFYRADKSRARESGGYGLGLAIAKAICEGFGGTIEAQSEVGSYTEFIVRI